MSINITISGADPAALKRLAREYERILSYDGKTVTVTVAQEEPDYSGIPPLIQTPKVRRALAREMLKKADSATSPWYRKDPVGEPFPSRINEADEILKGYETGPHTRIYTDRESYIRDNFDYLNAQFGYSRGTVEDFFRASLIRR